MVSRGVNSPGLRSRSARKLTSLRVSPRPWNQVSRRQRCGAVGRVGRRHDEAVGLHALVDFRDVAAHHEAGGGASTGIRLAPVERARSSPSSSRTLGFGDLVGLEEFVVLQRVADGLLIDQDVGQQRIRLQVARHRAQAIETGLQLGAIGGGHFDAGGRDGFDRLGSSGDGEKDQTARARMLQALSYRLCRRLQRSAG